MKNYTDFLNERRAHKLNSKDGKELQDFLNHVIENMEEQPNLLRAAYARIQGILNEIRKGNITKGQLSYFFYLIYLFVEDKKNSTNLREWSEKFMRLDIDNYPVLLNIIHDYNQLVQKNKDKYGKINDQQPFNIKAWIFEPEGIEAIKESYEDYCDFGCGYIATYLAENPDIDEDEFGEYVTQHNKADRDMGELQDVSEEEIERLGKEFKSKK